VQRSPRNKENSQLFSGQASDVRDWRPRREMHIEHIFPPDSARASVGEDAIFLQLEHKPSRRVFDVMAVEVCAFHELVYKRLHKRSGTAVLQKCLPNLQKDAFRSEELRIVVEGLQHH